MTQARFCDIVDSSEESSIWPYVDGKAELPVQNELKQPTIGEWADREPQELAAHQAPQEVAASTEPPPISFATKPRFDQPATGVEEVEVV